MESGKPSEAEVGIGADENTIHGLSLADRGGGSESEIENRSGAAEKTRNGLSLADSEGEIEPENRRLAELRHVKCGACRRMKRRILGWRVDNRLIIRV